MKITPRGLSPGPTGLSPCLPENLDQSHPSLLGVEVISTLIVSTLVVSHLRQF